MIGKEVEVIVDRPLGSRHPNHPDMVYPVNCGYVPGILAGDGEEQDVYILGGMCPWNGFADRSSPSCAGWTTRRKNGWQRRPADSG